MPLAEGKQPSVPEWLTGWGTVAMAGIALAAMIVSIVFSILSGRSAGKAAEALGKIAKAQTTQAETSSQQAVDEQRTEARSIAVFGALFMGQQGIAVRNGNLTAPVYDLLIDFPGDDHVLVISARGVEQQAPPVHIPVLAPGEATGQHSVIQKVGGADGRTLIEDARLRFRDSRDVWWEKVGNQEPVRIDPPEL